jgi:hypothetical protein
MVSPGTAAPTTTEYKMTNLINLAALDLDSLIADLTATDVAEALTDAGHDATVAWKSGKMGRVDVGDIVIVVENNAAHITGASKARRGHGRSRLPMHPLYPAPIVCAEIAAIEAVLAEL